MRITRLMAVLLVAALLLSGAVGCRKKDTPELKPKVAPPAIAEAGVLKTGVDLSTPPYAGIDNERTAGIDVDVAAALAERLGLKVEYVDVPPSEAATALANGKVDVVMSVPFVGAPSGVTAAGAYLDTGPAAFIAHEGTGSVEPSVTLETLPLEPVAVQKGSESYWLVRRELGAQQTKAYPTLREALEIVAEGKPRIAVGDAMVAGYILRDMPNVRYAGQLVTASSLAVGTKEGADALGTAVREALDSMAADGVLENVRRKWVGDLPALKGPASEASAEETPAP